MSKKLMFMFSILFFVSGSIFANTCLDIRSCKIAKGYQPTINAWHKYMYRNVLKLRKYLADDVVFENGVRHKNFIGKEPVLVELQRIAKNHKKRILVKNYYTKNTASETFLVTSDSFTRPIEITRKITINDAGKINKIVANIDEKNRSAVKPM